MSVNRLEGGGARSLQGRAPPTSAHGIGASWLMGTGRGTGFVWHRSRCSQRWRFSHGSFHSHGGRLTQRSRFWRGSYGLQPSWRLHGSVLSHRSYEHRSRPFQGS